MSSTISKATINALLARGLERHPHLATRLVKAADLAEAGCCEQLSTDWWRVTSQTGIGYYLVNTNERTCNCPDFASGRAPKSMCKHKIAVAFLTRAQEEVPQRCKQCRCYSSTVLNHPAGLCYVCAPVAAAAA